jgi:hypothetical protein
LNLYTTQSSGFSLSVVAFSMPYFSWSVPDLLGQSSHDIHVIAAGKIGILNCYSRFILPALFLLSLLLSIVYMSTCLLCFCCHWFSGNVRYGLQQRDYYMYTRNERCKGHSLPPD